MMAIVGVALQVRQANRARKHEFEDIYVQRYWQIMDALSAEDRIALVRGEMPASAQAHSETRSRLWSYLELCEDEADQREAGLITTVTWHQWRRGIHGAATRPPYQSILDGFENELTMLPESERPFMQLRRAATDADAAQYDPRKKKPIRDWFTG
ncbi:hypothetical protein [Agrococcus sp. ARC_14]|uniref:hypothetical protein n=1 Tax=Agrococcus sp. ARC_14 TaxID=2919927 RepID=UPI001F0664B8|nr:hypothetical protein [Agrococcus sp. ARC_14]MCH1883955.1 hypothetical protein [Agrococcus sp. ARC_14]